MIDERSQKIIDECKNTDEPIFVLRATDQFAWKLIDDYIDLAFEHGCSETFIDDIKKRAHAFGIFAFHNSDRMKLPD